MNEERPNPTPADPANNEPAAARAESCTCCEGGREPDPTDDNLRALRRLRDLSMAVAEKLAARILDEEAPVAPAQAAAPEDAPDEPGDAPKPHGQLAATVLAFQRVERGVRQCILLSNKLHDDRLARETQAAATSAKAEQQRRERRKSQVARVVKEAIRRNTGETYDRLQKLDARIDEEDIESDIGRVPDSVLIDRLCKDCGVEAPWQFWAGEHWAQEEVRLEPPGSVFAGLPHTASPEPGPEEVEPVEAEPPEPAADEPAASAPELPEPGPDEAEPVESEPSQPEPLQPEADEPAASASERPEPEPPKPEPDSPYEVRMKARLVMALRSGAWMQVLQTDPTLAGYVRSRLNNSS